MPRSLEQAHPDLRERVYRLLTYWDHLRSHREREIPNIQVVCVWRSREEQADRYAQGRDADGNVVDRAKVVTWAKPGTSKHECVDEKGEPCSEAADIVFSAPFPWGEGHPWGTLRMIAEELCGLKGISTWDKDKRRFAGDRPHLELP